MLFFFISGVVMSVPLTLFIDQYASSLLAGLSQGAAALISVAIFAPFIEEFSKAFPLFYRHGETQRSIFNLALMVGLGFGVVEFLTYVIVLHVPVAVRLPGIFFHPASTSITAYGIATKRPAYFYLLAVGLHFANNFIAVTSPMPILISFIIVTLVVLISWQLHEKTKEKMIENPWMASLN
jgi:RsiW-degrading membrane proteinase PrsW (M82 family)